MTAKSKWHYDGPVYRYNKYIGEWTGDTWANSESKALANLSYRYKTEHKLTMASGIKLEMDALRETTAIEDEGEEYHQMTLEELMNGCETYN